jgi:hypothetical protein
LLLADELIKIAGAKPICQRGDAPSQLFCLMAKEIGHGVVIGASPMGSLAAKASSKGQRDHFSGLFADLV